MARTLRRDERIRRRPEYQRVRERGVRTRGRYMTLVFYRNESNVNRLGIIATRKIGGSVRRNRAKRLVREIFRNEKPNQGLDVVVLPRRELLDATFADLKKDYRIAVDKHVKK